MNYADRPPICIRLNAEAKVTKLLFILRTIDRLSFAHRTFVPVKVVDLHTLKLKTSRAFDFSFRLSPAARWREKEREKQYLSRRNEKKNDMSSYASKKDQ